jgi:nicotinate-nucleotide adenylyltransferase
MRVAFFGGSFDPPHLGHLHIALAACQRLRLDRVLLAPVGRQPLKTHEAAPFADRMAMLRLLIAGHPELEASEADRPLAEGDGPLAVHAGSSLQGAASSRPNYTVDTLARLRPSLEHSAGANQVELFFLAGADSFLTLPQWYRPELLLDHAVLDGWILAARPGFPFEELGGALPAGYRLTGDGAEDGLVGERGSDAAGTASAAVAASRKAGLVRVERVVLPDRSAGVPLYLLPDLEDPSTATSIRQAFAEQRPAPHLPAPILRYIQEHALYRRG